MLRRCISSMSSRWRSCSLLSTRGVLSGSSAHKDLNAASILGVLPSSPALARSYSLQQRPGPESDTWVVDIRSDTISQPTDKMIQAMLTGTTRDDVFNEDSTVHELQRQTAEILGTEEALFVPSGTMGNLICVLCHCNVRGREVIVGDQSHLVIYEQGGMAQLGGVMPRIIPNKADGTFDLDSLHNYIRIDDIHFPVTGLICVENTHGNCGGKVLPMEFLARLREEAKSLSLPVHMDGARVWNAAVSQGVEPSEIIQYADSVNVCLSKGVGAPIGSVIGGSKEFINQAMRLRKVLGGGWRQPGPLAAAAIESLREYRTRISEDHRRAKMLATEIMKNAKDAVFVDVEGVHSNVIALDISNSGLTGAEFCARLQEITDAEEKSLNERIKVLSFPLYRHVIRFATCLNQTDEDIEKAVKKIAYVAEECSQRS